MPSFYCNSCECPLSVTSVPPSANLTLTNGSRGSASAITVKAFFTDCGHTFCQNCKVKYNNGCVMCRKKCQWVEINEMMPPQVRYLFQPLAHHLQLYQKQLRSWNKFQRTHNRLRRKQLAGRRGNYMQAGKAAMVKLQEVKQRKIDAQTRNAKLRSIGRILAASMRNRKQATRPVEQHQHQAAQSGYHNRNDRTTSTQHGDAVFRNREFSTHHHGYAHDAPSQSPIHPNEGNPHVTYDRSRNPYQFIHSTPHSRMG